MRVRMLARIAIALAVAFLALSQGSAFADNIVDVSIDTSGLGSLSDSEIFVFLIGSGDNIAHLSNVSLGGGTAGVVDAANSLGSGTNPGNSLASGVVLSDSAEFLNIFAQSFLAGDRLSFVLDLTLNQASVFADQFSVAILDPSGNPITTSDPTGSDTLLAINIDSANPAANVYSDLVTVTPHELTPVPEASSLSLLGAGLLCVMCWRKWTIGQRQRQHSRVCSSAS